LHIRYYFPGLWSTPKSVNKKLGGLPAFSVFFHSLEEIPGKGTIFILAIFLEVKNQLESHTPHLQTLIFNFSAKGGSAFG